MMQRAAFATHLLPVRSNNLVIEMGRVRKVSQEHIAAIQKSANSGEFQSLKELCSKMYKEICSYRERENKLRQKLMHYKVNASKGANGEESQNENKGENTCNQRIWPEVRKVTCVVLLEINRVYMFVAHSICALTKVRLKRYPSDPCLYRDSDDKPSKVSRPEQDQTKWETAMRAHVDAQFSEKACLRNFDLSIENNPFVLVKTKSGGGTPGRCCAVVHRP